MRRVWQRRLIRPHEKEFRNFNCNSEFCMSVNSGSMNSKRKEQLEINHQTKNYNHTEIGEIVCMFKPIQIYINPLRLALSIPFPK